MTVWSTLSIMFLCCFKILAKKRVSREKYCKKAKRGSFFSMFDESWIPFSALTVVSSKTLVERFCPRIDNTFGTWSKKKVKKIENGPIKLKKFD